MNNNPTPAYIGFISNRDYNRVHNAVSGELEAELPKLKVDDLDGMSRSDMLTSYYMLPGFLDERVRVPASRKSP